MKSNGFSKEEASAARKRAAAAVLIVAVFVTVYLVAAQALASFAAQRVDLEDPAADLGAGERVEVPSDPFYILLIGSDSRKGTAIYTGRASEHSQVDQHSDIMTLVRVDPNTPSLILVTIPRDTQLAGSDGKINEALAADNDPEAVVAAAERLTGVEIAHYAMIGFTGFEDFVDAIGGLTVNVPQTVTVQDPSTAKDVTVREGENQLLDGSEALALARSRKEYEGDQDALRQMNVRNLESAIIWKGADACLQSGSSGSAFSQMLNALIDNIDTDMSPEFIRELTRKIAMSSDTLAVYSCTGPYEGAENQDGLWVVPEDAETWQALMDAVDAGQDPSGIVMEPEFPQN